MICFVVYCLFHPLTSTWNPQRNEEGERRNETIQIKEMGDVKGRKTSSRKIRLYKCHRSAFVKSSRENCASRFRVNKGLTVFSAKTENIALLRASIAGGETDRKCTATLQQKSYRRHKSGEATFVLRIPPPPPQRYHLSLSSTCVLRGHVACRPWARKIRIQNLGRSISRT